MPTPVPLVLLFGMVADDIVFAPRREVLPHLVAPTWIAPLEQPFSAPGRRMNVPPRGIWRGNPMDALCGLSWWNGIARALSNSLASQLT